jgi:2-amino-4-hydroxy-6-hydroxymethyldihydropteridine diphosphokinase
MPLAFVALGSNLAHPRRRVASAVAALARLPRSRLLRVSVNYVTAPIGTPDAQPDYVNAVAAVRTSLTPRALLRQLHAIERRHGRRRDARSPRNAARTLDLDLLLWNRLRIAAADLTVPHPRMHQRAFVLRPLADVAPAAVIPGRGLARPWLRAARGQRIARTRSHRRT